MGYAQAIGLVAQGTGMGLQIATQNQRNSMAGQSVADAYQKQVSDEYQADTAVNKSIAGSGPAAARTEMAEGTDKALKSYQQTESHPVSNAPVNPAISSVVGDKKNAAWAGMTNALRAPLQGYNEFTLQQMIKNLRTASTLSQISQNARGQAAVLPIQLAADASAQGSRAGWGLLLQQVGGALSGAGGLSGLMSSGGGGGVAPVMAQLPSNFNFNAVSDAGNPWSYAAQGISR